MYVYIYIHIYLYTHYRHTHTHVRTHTHTHTRTHIHTYEIVKTSSKGQHLATIKNRRIFENHNKFMWSGVHHRNRIFVTL